MRQLLKLGCSLRKEIGPFEGDIIYWCDRPYELLEITHLDDDGRPYAGKILMGGRSQTFYIGPCTREPGGDEFTKLWDDLR